MQASRQKCKVRACNGEKLIWTEMVKIKKPRMYHSVGERKSTTDWPQMVTKGLPYYGILRLKFSFSDCAVKLCVVHRMCNKIQCAVSWVCKWSAITKPNLQSTIAACVALTSFIIFGRYWYTDWAGLGNSPSPHWSAKLCWAAWFELLVAKFTKAIGIELPNVNSSPTTLCTLDRYSFAMYGTVLSV